jgi:hypothetical protein
MAVRWPMTVSLRFGAAILSLVSLPGVLAVLNGDVAVAVVTAILLSLFFLYRKRDTAAGLLAALALVKPQLGLPYIAYVVLWGAAARRWNFLGWLTTGLAMLLGISTALLPTWILQMARQVLDYADLEVFRSTVSRLVGSRAEPYSVGVWITTAVVLGYLFWEWRLSLRRSERSVTWAVMLTLVVSVLVTPFSTLANQILLVPPLLFSAHILHERLGPERELHVAFLLIAFTLASWTAAPEGLGSRPPSTAALIVPPAITLLSLWWVRWWAVHAPLALEGARLRPPG